LGSSMKEAAIEAGNLKKAQQELKDGAAALEVQNKKEQTQIQQLLLQSKNRTLSEKERMDMIDRATKIENEAHERKKKQNDEEIRIAYEKIMIGKNMTDEEKKRLKDEGLSYAELLKEKYQISDDETDKLKEALLAKEDIEQESIGIVEKAMNRRDALSDAEITKAEKRAEEKKKTDEEAAKKAIETERTMADSKLAVMVEGEEKQIAISDEAFKRTLEDLKANGQLTNELRQNLEEAHQYDLAKIKNDFAKQAEEKNKADLDTALSDFEKNTQKEAELISADYRQKELDLKKEYSKGIYSKEQYEAKLLEIQSDAVRDANDKTIVRLKKELSISGLSVDKRAELSKQLTDLQIANENASLNHTIKTNEDKVKSDKETFDKRVQIAGELASAGMELFSAIADFDKQLSDNRIADLDAEQKKNDETFNARQANLDRALMSDANREEAQKKLDKDKAANDKAIADKVKAEKVRQAKWDKAQALTNAIINTALAAVKMFADTGVLGFVFAALSTAVGLASIAKIASAKIPEYATGTIDTGDGLGIWGEKRPEVAVTRTGQIMYAEQPTLTKFDAGTRIYKSVEEFEKNKTSTTGKNFEFDYEKMAAAIPKHSFELHGNGSFTMIDKMNNRITAINRNWKIGN